LAEAKKTGATTRTGKAAANGKAAAATAVTETKAPDPRLLAEAEALRARIHAALGQVVLAMSGLPRYRDQTLADLRSIVIEPLLRDRVLLAKPKAGDKTAAAPASSQLVGIAIWASVSEEVDSRIREQIKARVFPVRLKPEEWTSGDRTWLLDVIAPNPKLASAVLAGLGRHVKSEEMNVHPVAARQVDREMLSKAVREATET
jgi:hemolysin-activating ACP:hemolysin acyltransferase